MDATCNSQGRHQRLLAPDQVRLDPDGRAGGERRGSSELPENPYSRDQRQPMLHGAVEGDIAVVVDTAVVPAIACVAYFEKSRQPAVARWDFTADTEVELRESPSFSSFRVPKTGK